MRMTEEHIGQNVEIKANKMRILVQTTYGIIIMTHLGISEEHIGQNVVIKANKMRILVQTTYGIIIMTHLGISDNGND